jgi:predicted SprT family Zn-dependent metalloprotease
MLLYSKTITSFIKNIKAQSRAIMAKEMGLLYKQSRFLYQGYSYPLHFVVFEDDKKQGYFNSSTMQIGLNKNLLYLAKSEVISNILRHELGHLFVFIKHQSTFNELQPHGKEYREVCQSFGWSSEITKAKSSLTDDNKNVTSSFLSQSKYKKIKKLLSLAQSTNRHEAELATIKANELLLKYNIESLSIEDQNDEISYVKAILEKKKSGPTMHAIYEILQYFYVQPVFSRKKDKTVLEVVGTRENVELADYIAKFLNNELESFWKNAQKENPKLRGITKKKSYIQGVSKGFIQKLEQSKNTGTAEDRSLVSKQILRLTKLAYPKLSKGSFKSGNECSESLHIGLKHGESLSIRHGISSKGTKNSTKLIE